MPHHYFIAGTDTGVGKTYIAAHLLKSLHEPNHTVGYIKPFQTGCGNVGGMLASPDVEAVKGLLGKDVECHVLHSFELPACPYFAALKTKTRIDLCEAVEWAKSLTRMYAASVIEAAGGLMVPLTWNETILDFAAAVAFPVILVAANRLGCINHSLLSLHVLKERGIEIRALVLNDIEPVIDDEVAESNAEMIMAFAPDIEIIRVNHGGDFTLI